MHVRFVAAIVCVVLVVTFCVSLPPGAMRGAANAKDAPPASTAAAEPAKLFGWEKVGNIHLELTADEFAALEPPAPAGFPGPGAPGTPAPPPPPGERKVVRPSEPNLFGMQFPWCQADISLDGTSLKKVGVRYAGDITYFVSAMGVKRPLKIELGRFAAQDFRGVRTLHLHPGGLDPAKAREVLSYAVMRAAGVPAPRAAFAHVTLTVPGKYDQELLGLYTVVEEVDAAFLKHRFGTNKGLLLKPARMRGLDYLGDAWEPYKNSYQPRSEPTKDEAQRVIDFTRLVNQANDEQFANEIDGYLDTDEFLRFMAANALLSNLESFFALGNNYHLLLHPKTKRFVFIPGDFEFSLANFLLMGTADQLMDLSVMHPYPGECKLADRLLAMPEMNKKYRRTLQELIAKGFTKERLLVQIEAIERETADARAKEADAVAARPQAPAGPGGGPGPGGGAGPAGGFPQPPDLRTFVDKRLASVAAQLEGTSEGYLPVFNFGPPPGAGRPQANNEPVTDENFAQLVEAPAEFEAKLFAAPPDVGYPVAISVAPTGEVFVAVDEQGSLGRSQGGGKVLRCIDADGDGKVDSVNVFAKMEHPRGVIAGADSVWVSHPPFLSVFHDDDGDGTSDRQEILVEGLTTELIDTRGGDHTTNGIRMGIDGWIYIADGDYGIREARGKDGTTISHRGGCILRVRPDGTELEIFATGLRNPFDIGIDPLLNLFTRDNTNDGGGWDVRVDHLVQSAHYGYTQLFTNSPDEIMPTLGVFGGGGGTGVAYVEDTHWPDGFSGTLYTGDWGRSEVYRHALKPAGATFALQQEVFLKIPRPTGMDLDAAGRLYVASWKGGEAAVNVGPNVGFVARVAPRGLPAGSFPKLKDAKLDELLAHFQEANPALRLHSQREILRRGRSAETTERLTKLASDDSAPLPARVAAIFTLKQLDGEDSHGLLLKLVEDSTVREFALRALADRRSEGKGIDVAPFRRALADESPRVRAQALISLARMGDAAAANEIIPLTSRPRDSAMPTAKPIHAQPDPDRVLTHLAMRTLVTLNAVDECLAAVDGEHREGVLRAMRSMHNSQCVEGLVKRLSTAFAADLRRDLLVTLIRLYHREADYDGSWWGIRPDATGPYYDARTWEMSERIGAVLRSAVLDSSTAEREFLLKELARHQVRLDGLPSVAGDEEKTHEEQAAIVVPKADPNNPDQIGNLAFDRALARTLAATGDAERGKNLFAAQSCRACHTDADGQTPKGPHLVDIGKRYSAAELIESIVKPSAKIAQGFETWTFQLDSGRAISGFIVSQRAGAILIRETSGLEHEIKQDEIEARRRQDISTMPDGLVSNLTPQQLADLLAYLQSLK